MVSAVERGDDAVIILYLLGSMLDRATNKTRLPIRVTATDNLRSLHALYLIYRTSLVWEEALLKTAGMMEQVFALYT